MTRNERALREYSDHARAIVKQRLGGDVHVATQEESHLAQEHACKIAGERCGVVLGNNAAITESVALRSITAAAWIKRHNDPTVNARLRGVFERAATAAYKEVADVRQL